MMASEHFSIQELTKTGTGLENDPDIYAGANLVRLAEKLLEPIREMMGVPLFVHSGFRSKEVNAAVGGAKNSAHMEGRACDFHPAGMDIKEAFEKIRLSDIPYDKLLLEHGGGAWWIHVQVERLGNQPRGKAYTAEVKPGGTVYTEVVK